MTFRIIVQEITKCGQEMQVSIVKILDACSEHFVRSPHTRTYLKNQIKVIIPKGSLCDEAFFAEVILKGIFLG
jgi:hypothetical protein